MEENAKYYDVYEENLLKEMLRMCTSLGMLDGELLSSEDIDQKWKEWAADYIAEALPEVNDYPDFAIACAGYAGMAVAQWWDIDWGRHHSSKYASLHGPRGFDDMDENIVQNILGLKLDSIEAKQIMNILLCCAQKASTFIHHEHIEAQTVKAFHVFARTAKVMFRIGAALQLRRLGYKFHKVDLNQLNRKPLS
ncbi:MAG: hypothetical protein IKY95_04605 [Bacteroidales bacterium]|nr:hypothetical protein [Bacteroidales bacterium]